MTTIIITPHCYLLTLPDEVLILIGESVHNRDYGWYDYRSICRLRASCKYICTLFTHESFKRHDQFLQTTTVGNLQRKHLEEAGGWELKETASDLIDYCNKMISVAHCKPASVTTWAPTKLVTLDILATLYDYKQDDCDFDACSPWAYNLKRSYTAFMQRPIFSFPAATDPRQRPLCWLSKMPVHRLSLQETFAIHEIGAQHVSLRTIYGESITVDCYRNYTRDITLRYDTQRVSNLSTLNAIASIYLPRWTPTWALQLYVKKTTMVEPPPPVCQPFYV